MKLRNVATLEPQPSYNQHPQYEEWKNICPNCRSRSTTHCGGGSQEFNVILRCNDCGFQFNLEQAFKAEQQRQIREKGANFRGDGCAPWGDRCEKHAGIYHYRCADCGADCTMGTPKGPPTTEVDGITRCHFCNTKVPRVQLAGKAALVAQAAPELLKSLESLLAYLREFWPLEPLFSTYDDRQSVEVYDAEAAIRKAKEGR